MKESLYDGVSNSVSFTLIDPRVVSDEFPNGTPIPFVSNSVTRMDLHLNCQVISSAVDTLGNITWDDDGAVHITSDSNVGSITQDVFHNSQLIVFDTAHPEPDQGQLMFDDKLQLQVVKIGC